MHAHAHADAHAHVHAPADACAYVPVSCLCVQVSVPPLYGSGPPRTFSISNDDLQFELQPRYFGGENGTETVLYLNAQNWEWYKQVQQSNNATSTLSTRHAVARMSVSIAAHVGILFVLLICVSFFLWSVLFVACCCRFSRPLACTSGSCTIVSVGVMATSSDDW